MAQDKPYQEAERKIAEALRTGATTLNLECSWFANDSEKLTELPESMGQLSQLQELNLSSNQLTTLPESMGQLSQLQELKLSSNQLTTLPEWLGQLSQLQVLYLDSNQLTTLPEWLGQLSQLQVLYLDSNQLTTLPEWLGQLSQLQVLYLDSNQLTTLPEWLGQLSQLQVLYLDSNQLTTLPEWLGQLSQLQELYLSSNQLTTLPESMGQLSQLQELNLSSNQLTTLPEWLGQLSQLQVLYLDSNQLTTLPESMGQLSQLQVLYLENNQLTTLPVSLKHLEQLLGLDLRGNADLSIPSEIAEQWEDSAQEILNYYFSTQGDRGSALRELKLLIVGRGGAGKTSLVKRLNRQPLDLAESETHGINISPLELACHDGPVTARVWDFGGQHVLHAMHEFFLTARSLYLLVLGEREDMAERDAAYWLQLIRSYAGKAPVVIAVNKNKGRSREMDRESLEHNYGPILAWVSTECSEGFDDTVENLRTALTEAANGMQEVRDRFPAKWWTIKERLESMREPYLNFTEYQQLCNELGEQDLQQQETLAAWLNDLGIAINYVEDERLHNTTVLRPDWLANGIYALLRANDAHHEQPFAPNAELTANQLGPIYEGSHQLQMLNAADYPQEKWPFLLQLMNLFQLAFPVDETGQTLLVPTLLSLEPPPNCEEPDAEDRTRLRYEFAVVPGPLLPKLLVRTFSLIDGERRWRRGAILQYGEAHARVWTTQDERWIRITAVGDREDRNELLTMIRVTLQELFAEYKDLHAVEQWEDEGDWIPRRRLEREGKLPIEDDQEEVD
ncbi:COR domain-containing protein [Acaryochloris marina]|uniref:leucine-rich repeat domain-containing protein n=1 Tax=Acaryochloris marina TaxID=155978 RepID=UPI001BAF7CBB|nr:COR domain-containing protein [Acaryochloris marina]QUY41229.1 leucine-rich repeat domain-containing protein [Acaryochloris marina S15]